MRTIRLYTPQPLSCGQTFRFDREQHHYLSRVLRLNVGDWVQLFNGDGHEYRAQLRSADGAEILERTTPATESPLALHLYLAMIKGEAMEWALQKAVELGVTRITPVITEFSERRLSAERAEKRRQRWQTIVFAAAQQCRRVRLPELATPQPFAALALETAEVKIMAHPAPAPVLPATATSLALLIGPEGGWSPSEVAQARTWGFQAWQLGPRILRADTAVVTGLALLQARFGDLGV